jgi:hypothetical protein
VTILFTPDFRAVRSPATTMDLFHRYYIYQSDLAATAQYTFRDTEQGLSSVRFKKLEELSSRDRLSARYIQDDLTDTSAVVEVFQWSYGGYENNSPKDCSAELLDKWESDRLGDLDGVENVPQSAKLNLPYLEPPAIVRAKNIYEPEPPIYKFSQGLIDLVNNNSVFPLRRDFVLEKNIDNQTIEIAQRLQETLGELSSRTDPGSLSSLFLSRVWSHTPEFGEQREPIPGRLRQDLDELVGDDDEEYSRFVLLLSQMPIIKVPNQEERSRLIRLVSEASPSGFRSSLGILVEEFPVRPGNNLEGDPILIGDSGIYQTQKPLQSLLEVSYALLGTSNPEYGFSEITQFFRNLFGKLSAPDFYASMDRALQQSYPPNNEEIIRSFLEPLLPGDGEPLTVEYYDFAPFGKNVFDYQSYKQMTGITETPEKIEATLDFAAINPEYNYYAESYEKAISPENIPEAALPNMYVYSFVSDRNLMDNQQQFPPWNNDRATQNSQLQLGFDRLITLDEFDATSVPTLGSDNRDQFVQYLRNYARALGPINRGDDTGVTIDFLSDLAKEYYNINTPASEMNLYNKLNSRKVAFPMYIELGFPMGSTGPVGSLIDESLTSTAFVDSVIKSPSTPESFYMAAKGFQKSGGFSPNPLGAVFDDYNNPEDVNVEGDVYNPLISVTSPNRIIDFNSWITNAMTEIETTQMGDEQQEDRQGECPGTNSRMSAEAVRDLILREAEQRMKPYSEILGQKSSIAPSETIIYKLTKRKINTDGIVGPVIQQFYFPNSTREHLVKFVDTQVKYNQEYRYGLFGITVVYGSKCEMRVIDSNISSGLNKKIYTTVAVVTRPNPKIVEHPIHTNIWNSTENNRFGVTGLSAGLAFPDVRIDDRPPPPPQILIAPFRQNYRQVLLALEPSSEVFIGKRAIEWTLLNEQSDWEQTFQESILFQKQFKNYSLKSPKLEFSGESGAEIKRMEIFRSDSAPENVVTKRDLYRLMFNGKLRKTLDISGDPLVPEDERAIAFDCIDTLQPNVKYYYTARSVDVHGKVSNPTPIYEVELVYDRGTYYPYVDLYEPMYKDVRKPSRRMARFLEIKAAPIQTSVKNTFDQSNSLISSEQGFIPSSDHSVENNTFIVRLTSRDTGRKIQFNLTFKKSETTEET